MPSDDAGLVERYRQGDPEAFDEIYNAYFAPLLGFLTRMCGNREDASGVLQDTFLSVFRYLDSFRGESSLRNWIYKIAARACSARKRRLGREVAISACTDGALLLDSLSSCEQDISVSSGIPRWEENPEKAAINEELRQKIIKEVSSMPYIYKSVLNLRDFEGFSVREVSHILGIKESTVKVRLHRARQHLRTRLAAD